MSMGFSKQRYWSGLPFPSPGNLPEPGIESRSLAGAFFYHLSHQGSLLKSTHLTPVVHRTVWKVLVNRTAFSLSPVNILGDTLGNYDLVVLSPRPRRSENTHRKLVVKPKLKLKAPTSLEWSPHNPTQPLSFRYFLGMAKRGSLGVNVTQEILILCDQVVITHLGF